MATMARTGMTSVVHRFRSCRYWGLRKCTMVASEHSVWLTSKVNVATIANQPNRSSYGALAKLAKFWADLLEYQMIRNSPIRSASMIAAVALATWGSSGGGGSGRGGVEDLLPPDRVQVPRVGVVERQRASQRRGEDQPLHHVGHPLGANLVVT